MLIKNIVVYTDPPDKCDICRTSIGLVFYDCATIMGPWANLCPICYKKYGRGLGTGVGQMYQLVKNKFIKIEG